MDTQNITLSLSKDLLRKVKLLAVEKGTSISGLMTALLKDLVARDDAYQKAWRRSAARMKTGFDMGTNGSINWRREDLHER